MGRTLPIIVFVAAVLAALAAALVSGPIVAIVPVVGLVAAVFLILLRHRNGYLAGSMLAIFCLLALVMAFGGVSGKGDTEVGGASNEVGQSMAVASAVLAAGALLGVVWTRMEPTWMPIVWLIVLLVGLGMAFGMSDAFGDPGQVINYVVAIVVLAGGVPALVMAMRGEPEAA